MRVGKGDMRKVCIIRLGKIDKILDDGEVSLTS